MAKLVANVPDDFKKRVLAHIGSSGGRWSSQSHFIKEAVVAQIKMDKAEWRIAAALFNADEVFNFES